MELIMPLSEKQEQAIRDEIIANDIKNFEQYKSKHSDERLQGYLDALALFTNEAKGTLRYGEKFTGAYTLSQARTNMRRFCNGKIELLNYIEAQRSPNAKPDVPTQRKKHRGFY